MESMHSTITPVFDVQATRLRVELESRACQTFEELFVFLVDQLVSSCQVFREDFDWEGRYAKICFLHAKVAMTNGWIVPQCFPIEDVPR